jgi:peroxiredoxin
MKGSQLANVLVTGIITVGLAANAMAQKTAKLPQGVEELALGAKAPGFDLPGTDDKQHSLESVKGEKGTMVVFTCNHCPYAIAYQDRVIALAAEYKKKGIGVVAISSNDAESFEDDSFPLMKERAKEKGFNFPYLYDGTQAVALRYGPMVTPHVFLFDSTLALVYRGRVDDNAKPEEVKERDLNTALTALVSGGKIAVNDTKEFGCSIKWRADVLETGKPGMLKTPEKKSEAGS